MKHILILGAGIGGLSAAIHLAAKGHRVTMLEQNPAVGGKMSEIQANGFRFDTGPSIITMKHVFKNLFRTANRKLEDYLTLLPVEPLTRYFYPDGTRLDLNRDLPRTIEQIQRLEPRDAAGYLAFLSEAARLHRITGPVFTYGPPPSPASLKQVSFADMLAVDPIHTLQWSIEKHVRHPHMRQLLGRFATYVGASPYLSPAALAVIAHVEVNEGVWYPKGGIYAIARAYEKLARELGVDIRLNARVKEIQLKGKKISGIFLEDGERFEADTVISNIDVITTYNLIHSPIVEKRRRQLHKSNLSCSGVILLLGVEGNYPDLVHHNIFFSSDYKHEFKQLFAENKIPDDPTLYVCITSKTDKSHAPDGCENWFVMAHSPTLDLAEREEKKAAVTEMLLDRLAAAGLDVRRSIRYQRLLDPHFYQQHTGAYRGALYGISFNDRFAPFKRPRNQSADVEGLYFAGGTTHPGGGVPMVTLSGKLAAEMADQS
jgi:phytoene desaturase